MIELPLSGFSEVFHAGLLTVAPEERSPTSLEGSHLSVSRHPEAWRTILQRSHYLPLWRLSKPGGVFLNMTKLSQSARDRILAWGIDQGLVFEQEMLRLEAWNVPCQRWDVDSEFAAEDEDLEGDASQMVGDHEERVTRVKAILPSGLTRFYPQKHPLTHRTLDFLILHWTERHLPLYDLALDGVWWQDPVLIPEGSPEYGSAPRGCIFESSVASWDIEQVSWQAGLDEALGAVEPAAAIVQIDDFWESEKPAV